MTDEKLFVDDLDSEPPKADFGAALQALRDFDTEKDLVTLTYGLSGLIPDQLAELAPVWKQVRLESQRRIVKTLAEVGETDFLLDFGVIGHFCLNDPDAAVRKSAIEILWMDESLEFMRRLMDLARNDPAIAVRAAALSELGRFLLLGEMGDLPQEDTVAAQEVALQIWNDRNEPIDARRRALEAIANGSHPIVPEAIREAYASPDQPMQVSAVFAMGRSYDQRWADSVLEEISNEDQEIRYEAARAAGALELVEAVPALATLTVEDDREVQEVAISSLGEIGGQEALRILHLLAEKAEEDDDDALADAVDDAIGNASLTSDFGF